MLQNIRDNSQGWIAKTIIGVIIVLLSLTGFDAIIRATDHSNVAAKVNGDDISLNEVQQAVDMQRRQLLQRLGKDFDPSMLDDKLLKEAALKGLIERTLLLQAAKDDKFAFSDQALDQLILQTPEFQVDGKFNADRFDQVIRQMNYSRMQFRQMLGARPPLSASTLPVSHNAAAGREPSPHCAAWPCLRRRSWPRNTHSTRITPWSWRRAWSPESPRVRR